MSFPLTYLIEVGGQSLHIQALGLRGNLNVFLFLLLRSLTLPIIIYDSCRKCLFFFQTGLFYLKAVHLLANTLIKNNVEMQDLEE